MLPIVIALHCLFTPPENWEIADPKTPAKRVLVGFVNKSKTGFSPSLNLTYEKTHIPLKEYLAIVQKNCLAKKQMWRQLGIIETQSGKAYLVEVETETKFGPVRLLQAVLPKGEDLFILTAGTLKKDFSKHALKIEKAFRSMRLCEDLFSFAESEAPLLRSAWQKKKDGVNSTEFTEKVCELKKLGPVWQMYMSTL